MNISVNKFPGRVVNLAVEEGTTVGQALAIVANDYPDMDLTGCIRVNNSTASANTELDEGDKVIITKQIKGNNEIAVIVTKFPGTKVELSVEPGTTVGQAIDMARNDLGGDVTGYDIRLNGEAVESSKVLSSDGTQRIILTKKIKGN